LRWICKKGEIGVAGVGAYGGYNNGDYLIRSGGERVYKLIINK
jgi:hypothetical protein